MNYTLTQVMTDIANNTIPVGDGMAQLTRLKYYAPFNNYINGAQYAPVLSFNPIDLDVNITNTIELSFNQNDLFVADDWIILNQTPINFTATLQANSNLMTNTSVVLLEGMYINGRGLPKNTTIVDATAGVYTLSANATINIDAVELSATYTFATGA